MKEYKARIADKILAEKLDAMGAVLIEGQNGVERLPLPSNRLKVFCLCLIQIPWSRT